MLYVANPKSAPGFVQRCTSGPRQEIPGVLSGNPEIESKYRSNLWTGAATVTKLIEHWASK